MRFPPRLALATSVLGVFAASSGAALLMPERADDTAVPLPEITSAAQPEAAPPAQAQAPEPAEPVASTSPSITGDQIAALALTPARDRAAAIVAEQEAEAKRARAERGSSSKEQWRKLRDELEEACDEGRIRGQICRSS